MCTALSLTWSLIYGNIRFKFSSVRLREAAEFRCCSLVALPVSIDVCSNTNHLDTRVTTVCCFGRVVYILIKCMDRDSSLSQNLSLIIRIWRGLLVLNGGMYQALLHIDE